ncbi:hypothetical protein BT93_J0898 [Corymbia citriodora subsp. variegata]|nr:hypothetical protein BT93_J0898 [Corymbia citriodora subsp. variegata]
MSSSESGFDGSEGLSDVDSESVYDGMERASDRDLDFDLVDAPHFSDPDDVCEITSEFEAEHDDRPDRPSEPSASYPLEIIGIDSGSMSGHVGSVASGSWLTAWEESSWEEEFGGAVGVIEPFEQGEPLRDLDQEFLFGFHPEGTGVNPNLDSNPVFVIHGDYVDPDENFSAVAQRGNSPAAASVVENLPLITVNREGLGAGDGDCAICLDPFVEGQRVKVLPCEHHYHQDCILPWLRTKKTCPLCRFKLTDDLRL